eukprot:5965830-Amphidinium_carterae.1
MSPLSKIISFAEKLEDTFMARAQLCVLLPEFALKTRVELLGAAWILGFRSGCVLTKVEKTYHQCSHLHLLACSQGKCAHHSLILRLFEAVLPAIEQACLDPKHMWSFEVNITICSNSYLGSSSKQ